MVTDHLRFHPDVLWWLMLQFHTYLLYLISRYTSTPGLQGGALCHAPSNMEEVSPLAFEHDPGCGHQDSHRATQTRTDARMGKALGEPGAATDQGRPHLPGTVLTRPEGPLRSGDLAGPCRALQRA